MRICPVCQLKYSDEETHCFVDRAELVPFADPRIGTLLAGRYLLESKIGEGGMAVVYRARQQLVDRPVAVKVMNEHLVADRALKERFRREAKNAAAIAHPNIVEISDYGETENGTPYLVMELLEGRSLDALIERGPMPIAQVANLGAQIARGLARAHDFHVIHRDLKPENIFISMDAAGHQTAKILDFGIARSLHDQRLTSAGQIFGTPQYMAPERVTSIDAGPSADLYSLGVILFEMLTGRLPFEAHDIAGFIVAHMHQVPPLASTLVPNVPRRLDQLVASLMAKRPEERPIDAHHVERELAVLAPRDEVPPPVTLGPTQRQLAPTLPPTTLERWTSRAAIFAEMIQRAFPDGRVPELAASMLADVRRTMTQMHEQRSRGLTEQRKLEQMEQGAREGRERLGHAMSTLGQDLSLAREGARAAELEVKPYFDAESEGEQGYRQAYERLRAAGGLEPIQVPDRAIVQALREAAEGLDRWLLARDAGERARAWLASKQNEVKDLEYQTSSLRAQLEKLETQFEQDRAQLEAFLRENGRALQALDKHLSELGTSFVLPFRARPEVRELIQRLEQEGPVSGA